MVCLLLNQIGQLFHHTMRGRKSGVLRLAVCYQLGRAFFLLKRMKQCFFSLTDLRARFDGLTDLIYSLSFTLQNNRDRWAAIHTQKVAVLLTTVSWGWPPWSTTKIWANRDNVGNGYLAGKEKNIQPQFWGKECALSTILRFTLYTCLTAVA